MIDPRRLLDGGGDPLEAELLRSACGDAPPREGKMRLLGAMGVAAAATTAAGAGTASGAVSGAKGALAVAGNGWCSAAWALPWRRAQCTSFALSLPPRLRFLSRNRPRRA